MDAKTIQDQKEQFLFKGTIFKKSSSEKSLEVFFLS